MRKKLPKTLIYSDILFFFLCICMSVRVLLFQAELKSQILCFAPCASLLGHGLMAIEEMQRYKSNHPSTFHTSVCITFINISLAKTSHVVKPKGKEQNHILFLRPWVKFDVLLDYRRVKMWVYLR